MLTTRGRPLLVVFYSRDCGHCEYTLDMLEASSDSLSDVDAVFLTAGLSDSASASRRWPRLREGGARTWGRVTYDEWRGATGMAMTPSILVVDRHGRISRAYQGEVGASALVRALHT